MGVARGGWEKRRLQQKRERERRIRRRQQRNRRIGQILVGLIVLALIAGVTFAIVGGEDKKNLADEPKPCTTAGPATFGKKSFPNPPCMTIDRSKKYTAMLKTSKGTVRVELLASAAPNTVNNFVFLARQGFYDGSIFHRVIADFGGKGSDMIQGGDAAKGDGTGDPGYSIDDENTIPFDRPGYLATANRGGGNTNGSQFFFLTGTVQHLNTPNTCPAQAGQQASCHSVFGRVITGLDVLKAIAHVPLANEKPKKDVVLIKVTIEESA
jgi:cyclophilin family peptidyl-prolyl cis-trans isomerase